MRIFFLLLLGVFLSACGDNHKAPEISVYKSPTCGCCKSWIAHLEANGFEVTAHDVEDVNVIKRQQGLDPRLSSCHTAIIGDYVIEGHVPADDIKRLLATSGEIKGLAVPGMPVGSPGMEQGNRHDPYDVIAFDKNGELSIFNSYK